MIRLYARTPDLMRKLMIYMPILSHYNEFGGYWCGAGQSEVQSVVLWLVSETPDP